MCEALEEKGENPRTNSISPGVSYYEHISKTAEDIQIERLHRSKLLWLDNACFCCPWNLHKMIQNRLYYTDTLEIQRYSALFKLRMTKYSPMKFRVELLREFKEYHKSHEMYFLRIFFEIENSESPGKFTDMPYFSSEATVCFSWPLADYYSESDDSTFVKCGIWMYEMSTFETEVSAVAEQCLHVSLQEHQSSIHKTYDDMSYLIGCSEMNGLISGRHGEDFVKEKLLLLTRTLIFSKVLAGRKACAINYLPLENSTPIDLVLGYIYNGMAHFIEKGECLDLFRKSFEYGLPYLQDECAGFMTRNLADDCDFLVDVLDSSNAFERWDTLDKALGYFVKYENKVLECDRWKSLHIRDPIQERLIQTHVKRIMFL